jgi:hypothetical protein
MYTTVVRGGVATNLGKVYSHRMKEDEVVLVIFLSISFLLCGFNHVTESHVFLVLLHNVGFCFPFPLRGRWVAKFNTEIGG